MIYYNVIALHPLFRYGFRNTMTLSIVDGEDALVQDIDTRAHYIASTDQEITPANPVLLVGLRPDLAPCRQYRAGHRKSAQERTA